MQLYLRPFYNILRQLNKFEWTTEHQTRFEEIKRLLTEQFSNTIPDPNQPLYANFGIGATLLQSHSGTNKMNLISANSRLFTLDSDTTLYSNERMYSYNIHTYRIRISDTWIKTPKGFIYRS